MKNGNRRIMLDIFWIVLGAVLLILSLTGVMEDSYYSGMGGGLIAVGAVQLLRGMRYKKDAEYRENYDVAVADERNKFLSTKAWAWTGYTFVLLVGAAVIVCMILKLYLYAQLGAYCVCLVIAIYWVCYLILRKKY